MNNENNIEFRISHETSYTFSSEVFLEPHFLRLKPKALPNSTLISFKQTLSVKPAGIKEIVDIEGNLIHLCWFEGLHESLEILAESVVQIKPTNPFDFLIYPIECAKVPINYADSQKALLRASLNHEQVSKNLTEYGRKTLQESDHDVVKFITNLTRKIHADFVLEFREHGNPLPADKTFSIKRGSCRDLSWMQIQLLRQIGIASRFVSGYYYVHQGENPEFELHAWVEVFIPGAGWVGLDPSNGMLTSSNHIAIASGTSFRDTMPVSGSIRGDAGSMLSTNLLIKLL